METLPSNEPRSESMERWRPMSDVIAFQLKLVLDAIREPVG